MGVHDYTCFCHCLEEGEQCLSIHRDCHFDYESETEYLDDNDKLLPTKITDTHSEDGCASNKAHLLIFRFEGELPKTPAEVIDFIRAKKQKTDFRFCDRYSWDEWDFDKYQGYLEVLQSDDYERTYGFSVWQYHGNHGLAHDNNIVPNPNVSFWIINLCPSCFKLLTRNLDDKDYVDGRCSKLIRDIATKFNIDLEGAATKKEALTRIRDFFSFLPLNE